MSTEPTVPPAAPAPHPRSSLRRIWALLRPYWLSDDRWPGRGLLALVLGLNLGSVGLTVLLADWNRRFYDALQGKDYPAFLSLLGWFTVLAASYIVVVVFALYFAQMLQIRWRRWLTDRYTRDWLTGRAYYLLQLAPSHVENPEQRIQDDINIVANLTLDLLTGVLNAVVTLASFLVLLWTLSGTLRFSLAGLALAIPGYMVWVAILYAAGGIRRHPLRRSAPDRHQLRSAARRCRLPLSHDPHPRERRERRALRRGGGRAGAVARLLRPHLADLVAVDEGAAPA